MTRFLPRRKRNMRNLRRGRQAKISVCAEMRYDATPIKFYCVPHSPDLDKCDEISQKLITQKFTLTKCQY